MNIIAYVIKGMVAESGLPARTLSRSHHAAFASKLSQVLSATGCDCLFLSTDALISVNGEWDDQLCSVLSPRNPYPPVIRHSWLMVDGRHYDAECPQGVECPFDLPAFQRAAEVGRSHNRTLPQPYVTRRSGPMLTRRHLTALVDQVATRFLSGNDEEGPIDYYPTGYEWVFPVLKEMEPIPPRQSALHHDEFSMGTFLPRDWEIVHPGYDHKEEPKSLDWLYLVNRRTGQRILLELHHEPSIAQVQDQTIT